MNSLWQRSFVQAQLPTARILRGLEPIVVSSSATFQAAQAADLPTTLFAPLGRPSLTFPAPYLPAHIADTTSTSLA